MQNNFDRLSWNRLALGIYPEFEMEEFGEKFRLYEQTILSLRFISKTQF